MSDHVEGKEDGANQPPASGAQFIPALIDVPPLPPHYVPRPAALAKIKASLLTDSPEPVGLIGAGAAIGVQGMGGVGKSVLAAALARDPDLAHAFPDGIIWLAIGRDANETKLRDLQTRLARVFQAEAPVPSFVTLPEGRTHLQKLLAGKRCLLLLDDVWDVNHATPLMAIQPPGRTLITTRHSEVLRGLYATEHQVDILPKSEARNLLAKSANCPPSQLPPLADDVVEACGRLALALAMAGALVRGRTADRWQVVFDQLRASNLAFFRQQFPDYPYPNLLSVIEVSVNTLSPAESARYFDFAAFAEDEPIPESALAVLWSARDFTPTDSTALIELLVDHSLARRDDQDRLLLHDLQHDYVRSPAVRHNAHAPTVPELHRRFLDAYGETCAGDWSAGPDDGYFFQHLADHLLAADRADELRDLLFDLRWLQAKLNATDANGLLADCDKVSRAGARRPGMPPAGQSTRREPPNSISTSTAPGMPVGAHAPLDLLAGAIRLSAHVLARDKNQLPAQLRGRLLSSDAPEIQALVAQTDNPPLPAGSCVFFPTHPTLTPPGGPLVRTLEGHTLSVTSCVVLPDGRRALSGSLDSTLKVWDLGSGACLRTLEGHTSFVSSCTVLPDSRRGLSGSRDRTLKLWDLDSGACLRTLVGHSNSVTSCVVLPDARRALSGSDDNTLKLWDLDSGACLRTLVGHSNWVTSCVVLPDGRRALSGSDDNTLKLWDLDSDACLRTREGHSSYVNSCAVLPDGRRALSGSHDRTLKFWDLDSSACLRTMKGHTSYVDSCVVLPDGRRALSGSYDNTLKLWDLDTGACLRTLKGHTKGVTSCAVLPDSRRALSGSYDNTLKLWDLNSGACLRTLEAHASYVTSCAALPDGCRALSGSEDHALKLWNLDSGSSLRTLEGHTYSVTSCVVLPDGRRALSGSWDKTLRLWDLDSGACLRTLKGHGSGLTSCVVLPDGRRALSGSFDNTLKLWDLDSGACLATFIADAAITCCAVTPDSLRIIAGDRSGRVHFLTLTEITSEAQGPRRPRVPQEHHPTPGGANRMPKKHVFLSYCQDNTTQVTDLRAALIAAGEPVWWDQDIPGGQDWKYATREALKEAYAVVLCLSAEAQQRVKSGIFPEALDAIATYREYSPGAVFLIPVRLSECQIPPIEIDATRTLDRLQYIDLFPSANRPAAIARLLASIRQCPDHP